MNIIPVVFDIATCHSTISLAASGAAGTRGRPSVVSVAIADCAIRAASELGEF